MICKNGLVGRRLYLDGTGWDGKGARREGLDSCLLAYLLILELIWLCMWGQEERKKEHVSFLE